MTTPRFNRSVRVEFTGANINPITNLRVAFEVDKNDGQQFNHALLTIWNLNATSRAQIARPMPLDIDLRFEMVTPIVSVRLFAGYGEKTSFLYGGDILWAHNSQEGPDWLTRIELYTGLAAATSAAAQVSFAKQTQARSVLESILKPLELSLRYTPEAEDVLIGKIVEDYTASGLAYREADEFLRRYDLAFTIEEDGQGLVYRPTRPREPDRAREEGNTFSADNGLVDTPSVTRSGVEIRSLLRPEMRIFDKFFVRSPTVQGTLRNVDYAAEYYAIHLRHVGDTHGDDWHTEIEGAYTKLGEVGMP